MERKQPSSIIIRMPNWLGDAVMATAVIAALKEQWPKARLVAMISESLAPLFEKDPRLDEVFCFAKPRGFWRRIEERHVIARLKEGQYDMGILLTGSFSSAWWFYRARIPIRLGYSVHARRFLLTEPKALPANYKKQHLVKSYVELLEGVGIPYKERKPQLFLSPAEKERADEMMRGFKGAGAQFVIGVNPTAAFGHAKCWPQERFRKLTEKLLKDKRIVVVFFAEKKAVSYVDEIVSGLSSRAINMAGKTTLREFMALINACNLFLTNDSGPMHLAAALGVPLIALFGSTSDQMTGPYGSGLVIHKRAPCSPCFLRECPLDFRCMKAIEVEEVLHHIQKML